MCQIGGAIASTDSQSYYDRTRAIAPHTSLTPSARKSTMQRKQKFPYLVGSKWTAQKKVDGWRHFQVVNRKNQGKWVFAEMVAACDPNVRFWINAKLLKDRSQWQAGWQSLQEIEEFSGDISTDGSDIAVLNDL